MNRAERRARERALKKAGKKGTDMEKKLGLFDKIPENCLTCHKEFDKLNKEMVMSWNVVVRQQEEKVHLYCPECWDNAQKIVKKYTEDKNGVLPTE